METFRSPLTPLLELDQGTARVGSSGAATKGQDMKFNQKEDKSKTTKQRD